MAIEEGFITMEDGVRIYFKKIGQVTDFLMIPNGMYLYEDFKQFSASQTIIFYDLRNRGFSDSVTDRSKLARGVEQDADDLDAVRKHFGLDKFKLIGHSYIGFMIALYATKHPATVERMIQIGPTQPNARKEYPPHLKATDDTHAKVFAQLAEWQKEKRPEDPVEACKQFWSILRLIFVSNPKHAEQIDWGRCELANERNMMKYWTNYIIPSIEKIQFTSQQLENVTCPVLVIHGKQDRSAPYGGGRDWATLWPNARLLALEQVAHAPWIEAPDIFFASVADFLHGNWPRHTEQFD
jgi:proline iminopeptidase